MDSDQVDPVCGKPVTVTPETPSSDCDGEVFYFCSRACHEKFVCDPTKKLADYTYDLIIAGGGPAGISGGIYAALSDIDTLLLTKSLGGQAWDSTRVVNYPGFEGIPGPELIDRFQKQLFESLKLAHLISEIDEIEKRRDTFVVRTHDGQEFRSRTLLLTLGMRRRRLGVPGEDELRGKGVLEFHALLAERFADKDVAVVGGGNSAVQAALSLAEKGARVTLVARSYGADPYLRERLAARSAVTLYEQRDPLRFEGSGKLERMIVRNLANQCEEALSVEAAFVEIGLVPNSELVRELVIVNDRGEVEIDRNCRTGLPGLYAAGDLTNTYGKRILIASGEGAKAVLAISEFLRRQDP